MIRFRSLLRPIALAYLLLGCGSRDGGEQPLNATGDAPSLTTALPTAPIFADAHLERAVRIAVDLGPNESLTARALIALERLEAQGGQIETLDGIEALPNLTVLDLSDNRIGQIAQLAQLPQLQLLLLEGNQIYDLSPLSSLYQLQSLGLTENIVKDIEPLLNLPQLAHLGLIGNPLSPASLRHIGSMQERGVEVDWGELVSEADAAAGTEETVQGPTGRIVFSANPEDDYDLFIVDADGNDPHLLFDDVVDATEPAWAPDGRRLAYVSGFTSGDIVVLEVDQGQAGPVRRLTSGSPDDRSPAWSPEGDRIAFVRSTADTFQDIFVMDADGENMVQWTTSNWNDLAPAWSPEGDRIAFISKIDGRGSAHIFALDKPDGQWLQLTTELDDKRYLAWSPDGPELIFAGDVDPGRGSFLFHIFKVLLDSASGTVQALAQVTAEGYDTYPAWSPDGGQIVFVRRRDSFSDLDIMIVESDGVNARLLLQVQDQQIRGLSWATTTW